MKKIVVIGLKGLPAFGGAATVGENIILRLKDDYDFTVLSISSHASDSDYKGIKQVIFKRVGSGGFNTFCYYIKCMNYVLWHRFDLVFLHHTDSGYIIPFLKLKNIVLLTVHEDYFHINAKFSKIVNAFFRYCQRLCIKYADVIVAVSKPVQSRLENYYRKEILFIPNGITYCSDRPVSSVNARKYLLFSAGRIVPAKGLDVLLEALHSYDAGLPLKIAGDINHNQNYKNKCLALSNGLDVDFLGLIKDKDKLFDTVSHAFLFVFPSNYEAMSMMLLEVASLHIPIIASDIDANRAIFNNEEVLFFKNGDSIDLANKISYAKDNYLGMCSKAEKAYLKLSSEYSWDSIAKQYKLLFDQMML